VPRRKRIEDAILDLEFIFIFVFLSVNLLY
jgi:hypothetical protein